MRLLGNFTTEQQTVIDLHPPFVGVWSQDSLSQSNESKDFN